MAWIFFGGLLCAADLYFGYFDMFVGYYLDLRPLVLVFLLCV